MGASAAWSRNGVLGSWQVDSKREGSTQGEPALEH